MQMFLAASKLQWDMWLRGLIGAFISGGAGAAGAGVGGAVLDKQHDLNILALMGIAFLTSGIISILKFLETTPLPAPDPAPVATK